MKATEQNDPAADDAEADEPTKKSYSITVLSRAFDILDVFTPAAPSLGLKDIVRITGLPKTTAFRILNSLVERGYCELDPRTGEYSLGFVFLRFADIRRRQTNSHGVASTIMRELRDAVNETVVVSVRAGDFRVHVDLLESHQTLKRTASVGEPVPLYIGASGKVLLAGMEDAEIDAYLERTDLVPVQDSTITDVDALRQEIDAIRRNGFAESHGELIAGGGALAAPVKDYSGQTVACIDILTPRDRYTDAHRADCIRLLLNATQRGSRELGYRA